MLRADSAVAVDALLMDWLARAILARKCARKRRLRGYRLNEERRQCAFGARARVFRALSNGTHFSINP